MLTRRSFIGSAAAGVLVPGGLLLPRWPLASEAPPAPAVQFSKDAFTRVMAPLDPVHVFGPMGSDTYFQRFARALSDDVFGRLLAAFKGRSLYLADAQYVGERADNGIVLTNQWNTGYEVDSSYLSDRPPVFDLDRFRAYTDCWIGGRVLCIGGDKTPTREAFKDARVTGLPVLPRGVRWAALYLDETTGVAMRAIGDLNVMLDQHVFRWDVICG